MPIDTLSTIFMEKPQHIHLTAISGVGMAALAGLLKKAGYLVSGSDTGIFPPMSTLLERAEIQCKIGFDASHISPETNCVIIGNAVSKDNPEVLETIRRGIPYYSLPQALRLFFLNDKNPLVVAGTHGKTTTCSLLSFVLTSAGLDPGVLVGGIMKNFNTNHLLGKGSYFVVEGDEYNSAFFDKGPKFLHYRPHCAILTSLEIDHTDIYPDLASIKEAFKQFVRLLPAEGLLVASDDASVLEVAKEAACPITTYGFHPESDWTADNIRVVDGTLYFDLFHHHKKIETVQSPMIGRHNIKNTLAVIALTHHLGLSIEAILNGIRDFLGVARRQDIVGEVNDIIVMDDFAHHPTAITETLSALHFRYPERRIWAVFEPRSASSRRNIFQKDFVDAFSGADCTILANIFAPEKLSEEIRLDPEQVIRDLTAMGKQAFYIPTSDQILSFLLAQLRPGDLVCIMSSGGFGGIYTKLVAGLKEKAK
jgi:UDP-N-acetylmuramate: L-alanyl-gamma-D-glutamyl-meso-diaminopimelate ligase